jgi:hypothetical protein
VRPMQISESSPNGDSDRFGMIFAEVGSFYSLREKFHLTQEVKEKFTEKLHGEPRDLMGRKATGCRGRNR